MPSGCWPTWAALRELVSQHLINDVAGMVVAYANWALCADSKVLVYVFFSKDDDDEMLLLFLALLQLLGREAGRGRRQASRTSAEGQHHHHQQQHHHHYHQGLIKKGKTLTAEEVARISNCMAFITGKSNRKLAEVLAMGTPPYTPYLHIIFMSCLQVSPRSPGCTVTTRKPRRILLTTTLP
jgi:hypothetical protein